MRSPKPASSVAYYIVSGLLLIALSVAVVLFTQGIRRSSIRAEIVVAEPQPVECPTGERAPVCYRFEVLNLGPDAAEIGCRLDPAGGSIAEFLTEGDAFTYSPELQPGLSFTLVAKVLPNEDRTVLAPDMRCGPA